MLEKWEYVEPQMVSIVVPSRGGVDRLPRLFEALSAQTDADWEVIVVLDGDVDDSASVCAQAQSDPRIRSILFPENRGRSEALNAGFREARGAILVRCDDDLVPADNYVATHRELHRPGNRGLIGLYRNVYPDTPYARSYGRIHDVRFREQAYATEDTARWHYWAGNVSLSRATYELAGEYDTRFRAYGYEDVDMGYRLQQLGVEIKLVPELETPHYVAATTTAVRVKRAFYSGAARKTFLTKHHLGHTPPGAGLWGNLVARFAHHASLARLERLANLVDRRPEIAPKVAVEKCIAFLVESAAEAGFRSKDRLGSDF